MSQCPSKIPLPSPASALSPAGNSHPFVAMSGLLDSDPTLHRNILDASMPQSIHDASMAGPVDDAMLRNSTCDANVPAGIHEVAKPLGPRKSLLSTISSPTTTIRASSTPRTRPRPSNAAFITPAPWALVSTDDIANYACSLFQCCHTWSKDVLHSPWTSTQWDPGIPGSIPGSYIEINPFHAENEMALPAMPPLQRSRFPSEKSVLNSERTCLESVEQITTELMHRFDAKENNVLGALQSLFDETKDAQQFPHKIEAIPTANPSSSVPQ